MRTLPLPVPHFLCVGCLLAVGCSDDNQNTPGYAADAADAASDGGPTAGSTGTTTAPSTSSSVGTTGPAPVTTTGGVAAATGGGGAANATSTSSATTGLAPASSATTDGSNPAVPIDCAAIAENSDWELCESGSDFCSAVFRDGAGCGAVCASVGLTCAEAWEDAEDSCAPDTSRAALACSAESEHESDYCLCRGAGATSSTTGTTATNTTGSTSGGDGDTGGTGGASSTDSTDSTSASTSVGGTGGTGSTDNPGCETVMGDAGTVDSTIVVGSGETFDGQCRRYRAGAALGDGSQDENQDPVFRLEDGAHLINVVLGSPAADGIHTYGDVTLENIVWEDIGEDAMTIKESGTVVLDGGGAFNGEDKVFQINAASTFRVSNFTARSAGKFIRQNGDTTFRIDVFIDHCDISEMDEAIFRTDSSSSTVSMTNTRYSNIGDALFIGVASGNITTSDNTEY